MRTHPYAEQFAAHLHATQQAYEQRQIADYLAGFAEHYYSVQLGTAWGEDKAQLGVKIARDIERFELLSMELDVLRLWYSGDIGYGHLSYHTRLRARVAEVRKDPIPPVLIDRRENILVGEHLGDGQWRIISKIVVKARNYYEGEDEGLDI
jgi:hypothetical protein